MRVRAQSSLWKTSLLCTLLETNYKNCLNDWNYILSGQGKPLSKAVLKPLLLRELRKSPQLKEEIAHYDRSLPGTKDNSYDYLYNILSRRIELNRQQQFRASLIAHQAKGGDIAPGAAGPKAKAKAKAKSKSKGRGATDHPGRGNAPGSHNRA